MSKKTARGRSASNRRVGRVTVYLRGEVWYVYYYENGQRVRRRLGGSWPEAKQLAAQVNAQLATGAPAMLSFEPVSIPELRRRWLDHHEHVLRSPVATIRRYPAATASSDVPQQRAGGRFSSGKLPLFVINFPVEGIVTQT